MSRSFAAIAPAISSGSLAVIREGGPVGPDCSPREAVKHGPTEVAADCQVDDAWIVVLNKDGVTLQWGRPVNEALAKGDSVVVSCEVKP